MVPSTASEPPMEEVVAFFLCSEKQTEATETSPRSCSWYMAGLGWNPFLSKFKAHIFNTKLIAQPAPFSSLGVQSCTQPSLRRSRRILKEGGHSRQRDQSGEGREARPAPARVSAAGPVCGIATTVVCGALACDRR